MNEKLLLDVYKLELSTFAEMLAIGITDKISEATQKRLDVLLSVIMEKPGVICGGTKPTALNTDTEIIRLDAPVAVDEDGWITWNAPADDNPPKDIQSDTLVDVIFNDGQEIDNEVACNWYWCKRHGNDTIVKYRIHKEASGDEGWIEWEASHEGPQNMDATTVVDVILRNSERCTRHAGSFEWGSLGSSTIVKYRIHKD